MSAHTSNTSHTFFDLTTLSAKERYKLLLSTIVPRPIAWIVTRDREGRVNVAPFSFFNAFATDPPVVGVGIGSHDCGRPKDTRQNIRDNGQFVINLVSEDMAEAMNITAIGFKPCVSELAEAKLASCECARVSPPALLALQLPWSAS